LTNPAERSCRENKKKIFEISKTCFFENLAVYEIMWKSIAQPDSPQMKIWRMRIAFWITKVAKTS
jgi:hypothetical protein